jgi:hypothetical protein
MAGGSPGKSNRNINVRHYGLPTNAGLLQLFPLPGMKLDLRRIKLHMMLLMWQHTMHTLPHSQNV